MLAILSYLIAKSSVIDPVRAVAEHLVVAALVSSQFLGATIRALFGS